MKQRREYLGDIMKGQNTTRIFKPATGYRVVSMRPGRKDDARTLCEALSEGFVAQKDPGREGFYSVVLDGHAFYFHVHESARRIYILRIAPERSVSEDPARSHSRPDRMTADCLA